MRALASALLVAGVTVLTGAALLWLTVFVTGVGWQTERLGVAAFTLSVLGCIGAWFGAQEGVARARRK